MTEAARQVAGIGIHALSDGDWVVGAGVIDLFREPKQAYQALKEVFAPRYLAIRPDRHALLVGEVTVRQRRRRGVRDAARDGDRLQRRAGAVLLAGGGHRWSGGWRWPARRGGAIRAAFGDDEPVANETNVYLLNRPANGHCSGTTALAGHLRAGGAVAAGFSPETATDLPVVVDLPAAGQEPAERFALLADWVARGGCAVLLGPPPSRWSRRSTWACR